MIVKELERRGDLQWEISGLSGEWNHLKPLFRLGALRATLPATNSNADPQQVLSIEKAELRIDVLASLLELGLRFTELRTHALAVSLERELESESWQLPGFAI